MIVLPCISYAEEMAPKEKPSCPLKSILNNTQFVTRLDLEVDDNIFLEEDDEDSELKEILTQSVLYKLSKDHHFLQTNYTGQYTTYVEETTNVLSHSANFLYSYRPFKDFSVGIKDTYNWLQDNEITTTFGDRVLDLGYTRNAPDLEIKYALNNQTRFKTNVNYESLDVSDQDSDDQIDNRRLHVDGTLTYEFKNCNHLVGFAGFEHKQIKFPQISEKEQVAQRPYVGLTTKFPALLLWTNQIGFENIDMDNENNADDDNVDFKTTFETIYSLFTKVKLSYHYNVKNPSFRSDYTQYAADTLSLNIMRKFNPKTAGYLDYSFEKHHFEASDFTTLGERTDRQTYIQKVGLTLNRKIKDGLNLEGAYTYTKRDTDFSREGYTDNKISLALIARY